MITNMKRVALYCRVSTEKQKDEKTIDSQREELVAHCQKNNLLIVDTYSDDGYSGELLARPELDRLRDDAKAKKFEMVLIHAVDRLGRNHIHAGVVINELQQQGIEVSFLNTPPTDTPEGRLLFDIQSVVAQFEKTKILERTRRGRLHKANSGLIVGNLPPYGYRYVKKDKKEGPSFYEIDEEQAEVVRLIFDLYTKKGLSLRSIRKELYRLAVKPPKGGQHWGSSTLSRLISNETYAGITHYLKNLSYEPLKRRTDIYHRVKNTGRKLRPKNEWIPIKVPPIIERDVFEAAIARRETNKVFSDRNAKHPYLLRNMLGHLPCGYKMSSEQHKGSLIYRCAQRNNSFPEQKSCHGWYTATLVDELIWNTIADIVAHPQPIAVYLKSKGKDSAKIAKAAQETIQLLDRKMDELKNKEEKIASDYASDVLKPEQIAILMNGLEVRRQKIIEKKSLAEKELANLETPAEVVSDGLQKICKLINEKIDGASFETKRAILKLMVERVVLEKQKATIKMKIPSPFQPIESFEFLTLFSTDRQGRGRRCSLARSPVFFLLSQTTICLK